MCKSLPFSLGRYRVGACALRHFFVCRALANAGHDTRRIQSWLGHRSIVRYTELSSAPFKEFWR
jgi:integrase